MQRENREISCEICGRNVESPTYYRVNGQKMILCKVCASRGGYQKVKRKMKETTKPKDTKTSVTPSKSTSKPNKTDRKTKRKKYSSERERLVRKYGEKIRSARLRTDLTKKELARKIKEKATYISKIEKEKIRPPSNLVSKLERYLGIKLKRKVKEKVSKVTSEEEGEHLTVGDIVQIKGRRKNEKQEK